MSYPGGKSGDGVFQTIINEIPPHEVYVEPFAGGAAIYRHKRAASLSVLCEKNPEVRRVLKNQFRQALRNDRLDIIDDGLEWLRGVAHHSVKLFQPTFVYMDPPYPLATRTGRMLYGSFEWSVEQHRELLALLESLHHDPLVTPFLRMAVSTYPNEMYQQVLSRIGWRLREFPAMTRGGVRTEQLWLSYPPPEALHDYRWYGANKRRREVIRRRGRSLLRKIELAARRDPLEAQAVLSYVAGFQGGAR